jgi:two-component system phosphate regulon response regulator PhoB
VHSRTMDMHVQRLRRKLGTMGTYIETVRGAGYRLRVASPAGAGSLRAM